MKIILAEKPSQAQDIAKAFGNCKKRDGWIECGEWAITWGYGHLLEIDTEKIAPEGFVLPERFSYRPRSRTHAKQIKVIQKLLKKAEEVWVFTDPEREGELIARLILSHAGWKKWDKTYRMWTSKALTPGVVREEIKARRPIREFDSVYREALARQHADWMVGIPLSRVLMESNRGVWSVGRVQSPTLRLLVEREEEIRNFKPRPYWRISGRFEKDGIQFVGWLYLEGGDKPLGSVSGPEGEEEEGEEEEGQRIFSYDRARQIYEALRGEKTATVVFAQGRRRKIPPPLLFSLTDLQREASKAWGWSAKKTLDVAQSLYEKKLISYPRTESRHLSEKDRPLAKEVLKKLGKEGLIPAVERAGKRVFDDSKLTDHFALIPLDAPREPLSPDEKKLYQMIRNRFLCVFHEDALVEETTVRLKVKSFLFVARGRRILRKGWLEVCGSATERVLPPLRQGEKVSLIRIQIEKGTTKPPPRYTDGSLIALMKKLGIGTPATRSQIIESLIKRGYAERRKKHLVPTPKGEELVRKLRERVKALVDVDLTREWERKLSLVRKGKLSYEAFVGEVKEFVKRTAESLRGLKIEFGELPRPTRTRKRKKKRKRF